MVKTRVYSISYIKIERKKFENTTTGLINAFA